MAIAFVFPGQGSQAVGMGAELAKAHAAARAVFEEVDAALGQKLSDIMFEWPARDPDADRECPAGADGRIPGGDAGAGEKGAFASPTRSNTSPAIRWANIPRLPRPARYQRRRCRAAAEDPRPGHAGGRAGRAGRDGGAAGRRQGGRARSWPPKPRRARCASSPTTTSRRRPSFPAPRAPSTAPPSSPRRMACAGSCRSTSARPSIAR